MLSNEKKKSKRFKNFKQKDLLQFINNYTQESDLTFDKKGKIKLTSSDYFSYTVKDLSKKIINVKNPVIIGQVSGFFETASLAGIISLDRKNMYKPVLMFFDKNPNNIQNAIFNTLLIISCKSKEEYLRNVFQMSDIDIMKAFIRNKYDKIYSEVSETQMTEEEINNYILENYLSEEEITNILEKKLSLKKLQDYIATDKIYDSKAHLEQLLKVAKENLNKKMYSVFENIAKNMCDYFAENNNFSDHVNYLFKDINRNKPMHILSNDEIFNSYKSLISKNGTGNIKFLPGIDISKIEELKRLSDIMEKEDIISDDLKKNQYSIDIAVIPHIRRLTYTYPFLKKHSQYFVETTRDHKKKEDAGMLSFQRTSTLYISDYKKIGAEFIEEKIKNQPSLTNLQPIEKIDGLDFMTLAGINIGYIYTSYPDLKIITDMAKADKVDTMFIQSLIYSEHKRYQTKRRNLTDPKYPDLDSRLKEGKKLIYDLNKSGIKVVYQMGDEDINLREELFYTYFRKELKETNNFLNREDTDEAHDWIKNIIYDDLIPYMIRCGKDITTYYDEEGIKRTRIGDICSYINAIKNDLPLGDLQYLQNLIDEDGEKIIDDNYFKNDDMFKIVNETVVDFNKDNKRISVDMIANPNFSPITQYANPDAGILKRIKDIQTGAIKEDYNSQILLDSRQAYMGANIIGGRYAQMAINTPQLTEDEWYLNKDLLSGKKQVASDPVHKRVTQPQNRMNSLGAWRGTGDLDWIYRLTPYWKRPREMMNYVQKTGKPLPKIVEMYVNDIQLGSITERISTFLKYQDYVIYNYRPDVVSYLGDLQQGWNYPRFGVESRHTSAQSVGQQTVDFLALQRPFVKDFFGVIPPQAFEIQNEEVTIDRKKSNLIFDYLLKNDLIEEKCSDNGYLFAIKDNVNYNEIKLPERLKPYEKHVKKRLNAIHAVKLIKIAEGNHEKNTDWLHKGYKPLESLKTQLCELKIAAANDDIDIQYAEYILNSEGDFVEGSYCYSEINGYSTLSAHNFRSPSKGTGGSACRSMANCVEALGIEYKNIDMVEQGHLHNFEAAVLNDKFYMVIPGIAGQSGFEQERGYCSHPRGVVKVYWPDGRFFLDLISSNFLDKWEIKNPEIRKIGLENHIKKNLTQKAIVIASNMPDQIHQPDQRQIEPAPLIKKLGPYIPR